jgi:hypothetical protein
MAASSTGTLAKFSSRAASLDAPPGAICHSGTSSGASGERGGLDRVQLAAEREVALAAEVAREAERAERHEDWKEPGTLRQDSVVMHGGGGYRTGARGLAMP